MTPVEGARRGYRVFSESDTVDGINAAEKVAKNAIKKTGGRDIADQSGFTEGFDTAIQAIADFFGLNYREPE